MFMLACLIIAAAIAVFIILQNHKNDTTIHKAKPKPVAIAVLPLSELISTLNQNLTTHYKDLSTTSIDQTSTLGYRVKGASFSVALPLTNALSYQDSSSASESVAYSDLSSTLPTITKTLSAQGYGGPTNATPSDSVLNSVYFYQSKANVCEVTIYNLLDVTCASLNDLSTLSSGSKSFVSLYLKSQPNIVRPTVLSQTITSSKTSGYQTATVNFLSGSIQTKVYYYRQTSSSWQMVNLGWYNDPSQDGNITPNCEDFDSLPQTRAAFLDLPCYNSASRTSREVY